MGKQYTIFAHQSEYHLREELKSATREDIIRCDWRSWAYTDKQWPIALQNMQDEFPFICIMDRQFNIHREWKKES